MVNIKKKLMLPLSTCEIGTSVDIVSAFIAADVRCDIVLSLADKLLCVLSCWNVMQRW